jgi:molybdate transport system substrate-binding protein
MSKKVGIWVSILALTALTACSDHSVAPQTEIILSAASSLGQPLQRIKDELEAEHHHLKLTVNLGSSGALQKQIEQGAPVDLFWSAGQAQMDALEQKGLLLDGTRRNAAGNELVLIVPKDAKTHLDSFEQLGNAPLQKIAVGTPETVPAGQYAKQSLEVLGVFEAIQDKVVYAKDVTQVLSYVERGDVEAGLVYRSDAQGSEKVRVAAIAPPGSHQPIVYPLAGLKATKHPAAVQEVLEFLTGPRAQTILQQCGFQKVGAN